MHKSILMCAAATAALTLSYRQAALATDSFGGASVYEPGAVDASGYFVGDDGVIRYGAQPDAQAAVSGPTLGELEEAFSSVGDANGDGAVLYAPEGVAISNYNAPETVTIGDQVVPMETISTETLSGSMEYSVRETVETVVDTYTAPMAESPVYSVTEPAMDAAPVYEYAEPVVSETFGAPTMETVTETVTETYSYTAWPDQMGGEAIGGDYANPPMASDYGTLPDMAAPMVAEQPAYAEPTVAEPLYAEPVFTEPPIAAPEQTIFASPDMYDAGMPYDAPSYGGTVTAHNDMVDVLPDYVDAAAPFHGADFAARGDGAYGPSTFKEPGEGPAAQSKRIYISKSTVVQLPIEAAEILVSDPDVVRATLRTAKEIVLIGLQPGMTNISFLDEDDNKILELSVVSGYDLRPLRTALAQKYPGAPIEVDDVLGDVVISGSARSASEADSIRQFVRRYLYSAMLSAGVTADPSTIEFTDHIDLAIEDQVLVKVRIAEMRRSAIKQFGVDFNLASDAALGALTTGTSNVFGNAIETSNAFGANGSPMGGIAAVIAGSLDGAKFGGLVRAFEQHNVMRVLAEPTLTAVSGETASFLAGGQFPYPTSVEDGEVGYSFRDFGVALEFTPVVLDDGRISLTVATEVSELTNDGALTTNDFTIPGISVRRANTTVELPSGGTMSIAGMLLQRNVASHTGLPGLKNVPIVGQLLSSSDYLQRETEMVILVTPYLAKPRQEREFRLPTDGFEPASDFDFFVMGRIHKVYGRGDQNLETARRALKSPFGFIIE